MSIASVSRHATDYRWIQIVPISSNQPIDGDILFQVTDLLWEFKKGTSRAMI